MPRSSRITLWLALIALATPVPLPASTKAARKPAAKKASQSAEAPRPPLPQELPPVAPTVTYRGGQLTIIAQNSTLFDILTGVRKATGAVVDAPPASAGERVATRLGPGRPSDVLAALLNGSRFDYILLGSPQDPGGVRRLILSPRSGGGAAAAGAPGSSPGAMFSRPAVRPVPGARTQPPDTSEGEEGAPEETVEPAEQVPPEPEPQAVPPQQQEIKTPEQLQEELRQHEEQQRQQQQEQPPQ